MEIEDFEFNPISCDGIDKCKVALMRASKGVLPNNFIEGNGRMGGCVGGSGNLVRYADAPKAMEEHAEKATATEILANVKKTKSINIF